MSQAIEQQTAEAVMRARHSVKKYQTGVTIPEAELNEILELANTAPSSWNLQHWRFLVITDQANKEKVLPIAYGQKQVVESSATIIVLGDTEADKVAPSVYDPAVQGGFITQEVRDTLVGQIQGAYQNVPTIGRDEAIRNASFAAMQLMLAAKAKGYDTCPMGGFDAIALTKELNIPSRYIPVLMITLGKAAAPAHPSGRFPLSQVVIKERF
ncbi:MAG: nitroreductase family protein [Tumebacillaceae bacterium]